jgi:hypothetical protein
VLVLVAIAGTFATTLASNIAVNSGPVEFGQGLALTTACSGDQELIFTPRAKFKNVSGGGNFVFSSISVSNIPATCSGNDFIFGFYSETGTTKLNLDSRGPQNTPYVYFTVSGETGTAAAFTKPPSNGAFSTTNVTATGFTLVINHPDPTAAKLYRMTVETRKNVGGATSLGGDDGEVPLTSSLVNVNDELIENSFDKLAVSGFTNDVRVVVRASCGVVGVSDTVGLSTVYGYQDPIESWAIEIGFVGSVTAINNALDSLVYDSADCIGSPTLDTTVSDTGSNSDEGIAFNPDNGHYYKYVTDSVTWLEAFNAISGSTVYNETYGGYLSTRATYSFVGINTGRTQCPYTFNGLCGYFGTVTTPSENAYINNKVGQEQVWLGGSDRDAEGIWKWIDDRAPESDQQFSYYGTPEQGRFTAWNGNEPNCYDTCFGTLNEPALQMLAGSDGLWNNFSEAGYDDQRMGYIVEFGDSPADNAITYVPVTRTVTFNINP